MTVDEFMSLTPEDATALVLGFLFDNDTINGLVAFDGNAESEVHSVFVRVAAILNANFDRINAYRRATGRAHPRETPAAN